MVFKPLFVDVRSLAGFGLDSNHLLAKDRHVWHFVAMGVDQSLLLEPFPMILDPFLHDVSLDVQSRLYSDASNDDIGVDQNDYTCESNATLAHEVSSLWLRDQVSEGEHVVLNEYDENLIYVLHKHNCSIQVRLVSIHNEDCHDRALEENLELEP